ncbi:MAG: GH3 auxin-responsive promoter family protein [Bacteroidales bacterium]|nr:GH3 auxin-responsive promoter family protein [Bacteroidales bacterium]MDT8373304.1 GH3 auxin-responsive promoter family protein [Bacteroidales bacterium]
MPFIPSVIKWINTKRRSQIELFRKYPAETQQEVLMRLLARGSNTAWGKEHGYSSVTTHEQYAGSVPLQSYEELMPWVDRLRAGEKDLLWPGEVKWFAKSSGTTSAKSKFIPITKESLERTHYRGTKDCLVLYTSLNPATKIFLGKGLTLGGSHQINNFSNNSLYGDLSAILIENAPAYADLIRTPPAHIALIEDFEEKMKLITEKTVDMNITSISGVPSWNLVLIRNILQTTGKENLHQVWPNLEVFFHGGVSFAPYREQYRKMLPDPKMNYMETYNASEGFFAIQDDLSDCSMLLMLDYGVYYEFIPADEAYSDNPRTLTIGEVEKGVNYAIVISTDGGLWRYAIGDTVEFTSLRPHKIRITGRTKHFINVFGEEVIIDNAEKALDRACLGTEAHITEYTAGPVFMGTETRGSHEWVIEFDREPNDIGHFVEILDTAIKAVNSDYEAKRYKDLTLTMPLVRVVPPGTFYKWFRERDKLGGQHKMPRLSNSREFIESILEIAAR